MGVPLCFRADLTVFIGNNNVGFAGGFRNKFEGHIGEPAHVGLAALANFYELEVATDNLVIGSIAVSELDDLPILPNLERAHGLVGVEVALPRLCFQRIVHIHRVYTLVGDFKKSAIQAGPAQGSEQPGFQVALLNEHSTPHHFVRHGEFIDDAVILHQDRLVGGGKQHTFIGGAFMALSCKMYSP